MQTVIGTFDERAQAEQAVEQLAGQGLDRSALHIEARETPMGQSSETNPMAADDYQPHRHHHGFLAWLFGDSEKGEPQRAVYGEALRRGSSVVVVDAPDEAQAKRAVECLHSAGAIDVNERAQQWKQEGWTGRAERAMDRDTARTDRTTGSVAGRDGVLDVVQEELQVGKRQIEKGGVRVVQRVSEKPVHEMVRLREEEAVVERRPVDRPASAGELDSFKDGTLEVREMAEEPVVAKTARVVEEVRVGKQVHEREQAVEDTVRRKDVDVQRLGEGREGRVEREERAVASDLDRERMRDGTARAERDLDADKRPLVDKTRDRP